MYIVLVHVLHVQYVPYMYKVKLFHHILMFLFTAVCTHIYMHVFSWCMCCGLTVDAVCVVCL